MQVPSARTKRYRKGIFHFGYVGFGFGIQGEGGRFLGCADNDVDAVGNNRFPTAA